MRAEAKKKPRGYKSKGENRNRVEKTSEQIATERSRGIGNGKF